MGNPVLKELDIHELEQRVEFGLCGGGGGGSGGGSGGEEDPPFGSCDGITICNEA